jgi:hypothetical protein
MSGNKDLLNDYFKTYPVLRYLMPKVTNNVNKDVTNRLFFMRQAAWVLLTIINKNINIKTAAGVTDAYSSNTLKIFTENDLNLLSHILKSVLASLGTFDINSLVSFETDLKQGYISYDNNKLTDFKRVLSGAVSDDDKFKYILEILKLPIDVINSLITLSKMTTDDVMNAAGGAIKPAVDNLKAITALSDLPFSNYSIGLNNLLLKQIASKFDVVSNTIVLPKVYSYIGAMIDITNTTSSSKTEFVQDTQGRYILKTTNKNGKVTIDEFNKFFLDLITKDDQFCKSFGVNNPDANDNEICSKMFAECLGTDLQNKEACKANFKGLSDVSDNLRGWINLSPEQQRYAAYRVLLGYGINGSYDKSGNYTYVDVNGTPLMSDNDIKNYFTFDVKIPVGAPGNDLGPAPLVVPNVEKKIAYIKKLMQLVGTIITPSKDSSGRPMMVKQLPVIQQLQFVPAFVPTMGMGVYGHMVRPLIGGYDENAITGIQYGGDSSDIENIVKRIQSKVAILRNRNAIPQDKVSYINEKITKLQSVGRDIENGESIINDYLTVSSLYPNKNIIFTEDDIKTIKTKLDEDKQKLESKLNKFNKLEMRLIAIVP